jgi:hypothetical protein
MIATNFEYDGIAANDIGLYICSFDGAISGEQDYGGGITYNTSKAINSPRWEYHAYQYEDPMTLTWQAIHIDKLCGGTVTEITPKMQAYYKRIFERKEGYKYLRFLDGDDGVDKIFYLCTIKIEWYKVGGEVYGISFTATCDSVHGYSPIMTYTANNIAVGSDFRIFNDSEEIGEVQPLEIILTCKGNGTLKITQTLKNMDASGNARNYFKSPHYLQVDNCLSSETLTINGYTKLLTSDKQHTYLADDYNYCPLTLVNFDDNTSIDPFYSHNSYESNRLNIYTNTGDIPFNIEMKYRTIRTGVI